MKIYNIGDKFKIKLDKGEVSEFYIFSKRMVSPVNRDSKSEYEYFLRETENKIGIKRCLHKLGSDLDKEVQL